MCDSKEKRFYRSFNPEINYPTGNDLFYECCICGDVLPSLPKDNVSCSCRNIMIDIDYGRISIKKHEQAKLFSENK